MRRLVSMSVGILTVLAVAVPSAQADYVHEPDVHLTPWLEFHDMGFDAAGTVACQHGDNIGTYSVDVTLAPSWGAMPSTDGERYV